MAYYNYNRSFYDRYNRRPVEKKEDPYRWIERRRRKPLDRAMIDLMPKADKRFVGLDFEFLDADYASVCAVGLVVVENGQIVDTFDTLVKPKSLSQGYYQYRAHRITVNQLKNAPTWTEIWPTIEKLIGDGPIVYYNQAAEKSGFEGCAERFGTRCDFDFIDAYQMACVYHESQISGGKQLCNYHLPIVCEAHDVKLKHHHTAIEDATAAAQLFLKLRALGTEEVWSTPCR